MQLFGFIGFVGVGVVFGAAAVGVGAVFLIGLVFSVFMFLWFVFIVSVISLLKFGLLLWVINVFMSIGMLMFVMIL